MFIDKFAQSCLLVRKTQFRNSFYKNVIIIWICNKSILVGSNFVLDFCEANIEIECVRFFVFDFVFTDYFFVFLDLSISCKIIFGFVAKIFPLVSNFLLVFVAFQIILPNVGTFILLLSLFSIQRNQSARFWKDQRTNGPAHHEIKRTIAKSPRIPIIIDKNCKTLPNNKKHQHRRGAHTQKLEHEISADLT